MMTKSVSPSVVIVILNWNGKEDTLACLSSVTKIDYSNVKIVVVDNGSSDGSVEAISDQFPNIDIVETGVNLGYAGGNNAGIRWALDNKTDFILILNNDTIVADTLINEFIRAATNLPRGSVLGAKIYYYDKPDVLWFGGAYWQNYDAGFHVLGMGAIDTGNDDQYTRSDYITGCVLFAASETFKTVGLLDEDFYLTYEETDWCYRARAKGFEGFVVRDAHVWHKVSSSFGGKDSPIMTYFMTRNKPLWAKKNLPGISGYKLYFYILREIGRIFFPKFHIACGSHPLYKKLYWSINDWFTRFIENMSYPLLNAKLIGYRDFIFGRFGNCPESIRALKRKYK